MICNISRVTFIEYIINLLRSKYTIHEKVFSFVSRLPFTFSMVKIQVLDSEIDLRRQH